MRRAATRLSRIALLCELDHIRTLREVERLSPQLFSSDGRPDWVDHLIFPPQPHALDFDWRFDQATAEQLARYLLDEGPVLTLGAPSVARMLEHAGVDVALVDRQPHQGVIRQFTCDISEFVADRPYRTALVDPPWYPAQIMSWSRIAAHAVGVGGAVLVSIWPAATRPTAMSELSALFEDFSFWADILRTGDKVRYDTPLFEAVARRVGGDCSLSRSPLTGELVRLRINKLPALTPLPKSAYLWRRFIVDDYQLAIRCRKGNGCITFEQIPTAHGWLWPFVSARAPDLNQIDLWSSAGEVAALGSPESTCEMLRRAFSSPNSHAFERMLADVPTLLEWRVPRPPYRRCTEWLHRQ